MKGFTVHIIKTVKKLYNTLVKKLHRTHNSTLVTKNFLTNVQKLNNKGMIEIKKGGVACYQAEWAKKDQSVYIIVIKHISKNSEKRMNFHLWFNSL